MKNVDQTRRRFMATFAGPVSARRWFGVLGRMQDTVAKLTLDGERSAEDLRSGPRDEKPPSSVGEPLPVGYDDLRKLHIPADVTPISLQSVTPGMTVNKAKQPFRLSGPRL
jgi:hypothetical protein